MKKNKATPYRKNVLKDVLPLVLMFLVFLSQVGMNSAQAQQNVQILISPPTVLASDATGGTLITETFESFAAVPDYNWAPLPHGYTSPIGLYKQESGQSKILADNQYGTNTPRYLAVKPTGVVSIEFNQSVRYFGFAWPAGDPNNKLQVFRQGQVIATFTTADVINLIPNTPGVQVNTINGGSYNTEDYYGKPVTGQVPHEPYAYIHLVSTPGLSFDRIEISTIGGGGYFETDNHSILIGNPVVDDDWVLVSSVDTPTANDDYGSGTPGQAVQLDVLANDIQGDAALAPATVQILGTANFGDPLVVAGEGTWTVNQVTGAITFTPEPGFTGNPTPIKYSVGDVDGYASNLATVHVDYLQGPTAVADYVITDINLPVTSSVLDNDIQGTDPIDPSSLTLLPGTGPDPLTIGTFSITNQGEITFVPVNGFVGNASIMYEICDVNGLCSTSSLTVAVVDNVVNVYPATGPGTLGFEDLWPNKGDYDFNDLVIDYQFHVEITNSNYVEKITATFTIQAFGASYENGFGFQFSDVVNVNDVTVSGYELTDNYITLNPNGTEAGQSKPTIIVYDNSYSQMGHPGVGIGVNTELGAPYVQPKTLTITIDFKPYTYTLNQLDIAQFNPFLIVDKDRSVEVHLPYYEPTDLANLSLLGTGEDASNPSANKYYVTATNLPWAINIYEKFDYPIEKQDIVNVHLKFAEWATSGGVMFPNWYQNLSGYRNSSLIYTAP